MNELPLHQQFAHTKFQEQLKGVQDAEVLRKLCSDIHLLYLGQQALFAQIAKQDFQHNIDQSVAD